MDKKIWENFLQNLIAEYEKLLAKGGVTTLGQERYGTEFTATEGTSWRHYSYRQFDDAQNPVEQCSQHGPNKVYVHRHQKLLPLRANGQVWVYANEIKYFPVDVQQQYNIHAHAKNGYVYVKSGGKFTFSPK